jgi:hypothetical protein
MRIAKQARIRVRSPGEQYRRRDRAGAGKQRHRERESRNVADAVDGRRVLRGFRLALATSLEHHLEGDPKQQHPARDAKSGQADPEERQDGAAAEALAELNSFRSGILAQSH